MRRLPPEPPSTEITPEPLYLRRREFIKLGARVAGTATVVGGGLLWLVGKGPPADEPEPSPLAKAAGTVPRRSWAPPAEQ